MTTATLCREDQIIAWNCGPACTNAPNIIDVQIFKNMPAGTYGFAGYNNITNEIIAVFREEKVDLNYLSVLDLVFDKCWLPGCPVDAKVNEGF